MSAAVRRGWRSDPVELPLGEVLRRLRDAGCLCDKKVRRLTLGGRGIRAAIESNTYATVKLPNTPGGGGPPRYSESHTCTGCGRVVRR